MIVGALEMGATAAAKKVGGKAAEDAYEALKCLIRDRFKRGGAVAALEEDPASETQRKAIEEALTKSDAVNDQETLAEALARAKDITQALKNLTHPERLAIGVRIGQLEALDAHINDTKVDGPGIGVDIEKAKVARDFIVKGVEVKCPK